MRVHVLGVRGSTPASNRGRQNSPIQVSASDCEAKSSCAPMPSTGDTPNGAPVGSSRIQAQAIADLLPPRRDDERADVVVHTGVAWSDEVRQAQVGSFRVR